MNEMVERVARAVEAEYLAIATEAMNGGAIGFSRTDKDHLRIAHAAIEAMREPTDEMVALGARALRLNPADDNEPLLPRLISADAVHRAMIVAALKPQT